ncbi:MAG TPA: hypothetical protein PKC19_23720, partial [Roseiflexaceae bacterium]|nr:hypothetical protein [Roseiflexaceae bacterium]
SNPGAFWNAQVQSVVCFSAFEGTSNEQVILDTWMNTGNYYISVRGRNGIYDPLTPFTLNTTLLAGQCGGVNPNLANRAINATDGDYRTIILTDMARMVGSAAEKAALNNSLAQLAARSEVAGVVVDVGSDIRIIDARGEADANTSCPFAQNLVAASTRDFVAAYRAAGNPLEYVVLVGNDDVFPFFRYPDPAEVSKESDYQPPVLDNNHSQASLRLDYMLGQDAYGARTEVSLGSSTLPIPDLAVGRLVETAADATIVVNTYLNGTVAGTGTRVTPPTRALVTSYGFLEDGSRIVADELAAGLGTGGAVDDDLLIAADIAPGNPLAWTGADLQAKLTGVRHDLIYLAGHFTSSRAEAADYATGVAASEIVATTTDYANTIIFSAGCHAGYNQVDTHIVPGLTSEPDWPQAFAQRGAALIAGTGYQYGDSDLTEYGERLYLEFARELRTGPNTDGTGPVAIGQALMAAKRNYMNDTAVEIDGVFKKTIIVSALFGLPMLSVDMPGERIVRPTNSSIVTTITTVPDGPGAASGLDLRTADLSLDPTVNLFSRTPTDVINNPSVTTTYATGPEGRVTTRPGEPILPLEIVNISAPISAPGYVLRGVGFRGGAYTDN